MYTQQLSFCDATSSLDRFNTSLYIISTSHAAGGLPLGVITTLDEQEETIRQGLEMLKEVLPKSSFNGQGVERGPGITMTDGSSIEWNAIHIYGLKSVCFCVSSTSFRGMSTVQLNLATCWPSR